MENEVTIKDTTGNPAALGLVAFGMTTVLLNLSNAGLFALGSMILGMGIFYGGLAQIIAGIMEWKKGNTFGTTAFTSYGLFWMSFVALVILPGMGIGVNKPQVNGVVAYLIMWGIFTGLMFIGTLKANRALQTVFLSLTVLFFLLGIGAALGSAVITIIAGYEGIFCGFSAIYTGIAEVINESLGKTVLPLWPVQ